MKEIQESIRLVRESLDNGLATTERFEHMDKTTYVHFKMGEDTTYVGKVVGNEPEEITIARRLMQGRLNLGIVSQSESMTQEALGVLKQFEHLRQEAGLGNGQLEADVALSVVIPELYTKEVLVYQHNVMVTMEDLQNSHFDPDKVDPLVKLALNAAYSDESLLALDTAGAYRPVMKLTVPDHFDTIETLRTIKQVDFRGAKALEEYAKIELLDGVDPNVIKAIGDASVLRMDGKNYRSLWDEISVLDTFKGEPAAEPKLEKSRVVSLDGPGM